MSPRRIIESDAAGIFEMPPTRPPLRRLALISTVAGVALIAALTASAVAFGSWRTEHQREIREAAVLSFVRSFLTQYTSPDPFHANDYADKILAFVVQVARAEPGVGSVQELGIEHWNDDGSANVVAVSTMITTMPDGRKIPSGSRWVVTASKEGEQWKVSNLIQVV